MHRFFAACLAIWFASLGPPIVSAAGPDFDKEVAPLFARRCLDCHNAVDLKGNLNLSSAKTALAGGESGVVLVPGKPDESLIWQHVSADEMPPKKPLSAAEKKLLRDWIASGAKWGADPIDPFRFTTEARAGYDWWALQPVRRPPLPASTQAEHPIDAFILAKLAEKKLSLSPPAERRALLRRLSFDLRGLPPTPEEAAAFLSDDSPDAYEKLVDRLLASPAYGERWARHWLDLVRFGESQGFERDKLRETSWRYRDWCVSALNADLSYAEFARLQLAGDALRPNDPAALIATGFLVAGPFDEVGQSQQSLAMRAVVRQDELEDIVGTVAQTFLGLTVNCARCHDHKFDPVRQVEYFRLTAALSGARHGERDLVGLLGRLSGAIEAVAGLKLAESNDNFAAGIGGRLKSIESRLIDLDAPARKRILTVRESKALAVSPPKPLAAWEFNGNAEDSLSGLHARLEGSAKLAGGGLVLDGKEGYAVSTPVPLDLGEKTLEAWVSLRDLKQRGGGVLSVQTPDGSMFDAIVFGEKEPGRWMAGSNGFVRTQEFGGGEETEANKAAVHVAIVYQADGTIAAYRSGQPYGKPYKSAGLVTFKAGQAHIAFGMRHGPPGGNKMLAGAIDRARVYDRALTADEVAASAGVASDFISEQQLLAELSPGQREERARLVFESTQLKTLRSRAQSKKAYAALSTQPPATHLLRRGNPAAPAELLAPGGVASVVGLSAEFGLAADAPDAERRIKLAAWVTDAKNPLFSRVVVNRLWQYHFGVGLVETPNDFGFNGGRPSHAELLDWLASELAEQQGSLKALHRLILTSSAYRQSSLPDSQAAQVDADNRLLWRKEPLRLEAEAVRDAMLSVSGELNTALGGPGFEDYVTFTRNSQFYEPLDPIGPTFQRRSLYRTWVRSGRNRFLDALDCPDPSTKTPRRAVTTTPLQALSLLNNSFVLRMSDRFAERIALDAGASTDARVQRAYDLAYARSATPEELALARPFVAEQGLSAFCRVIFNTSEFLYVD